MFVGPSETWRPSRVGKRRNTRLNICQQGQEKGRASPTGEDICKKSFTYPFSYQINYSLDQRVQLCGIRGAG
jgi:hypothetical protein